MRVIGYAYMADLHCPSCTATDARNGRLEVNNYHPHAVSLSSSPAGNLDEHGLHFNLTDREGNLIHPIFDIDENPDWPQPQYCRDCGSEIE